MSLLLKNVVIQAAANEEGGGEDIKNHHHFDSAPCRSLTVMQGEICLSSTHCTCELLLRRGEILPHRVSVRI